MKSKKDRSLAHTNGRSRLPQFEKRPDQPPLVYFVRMRSWFVLPMVFWSSEGLLGVLKLRESGWGSQNTERLSKPGVCAVSLLVAGFWNIRLKTLRVFKRISRIEFDLAISGSAPGSLYPKLVRFELDRYLKPICDVLRGFWTFSHFWRKIFAIWWYFLHCDTPSEASKHP